ncbi:MAG: hypothetical protein JJU11_01460 [Candidatus Sumerlaeia bacterium]|nr:hypothetical protein [Candidatus Sumerlaeia bacterium]
MDARDTVAGADDPGPVPFRGILGHPILRRAWGLQNPSRVIPRIAMAATLAVIVPLVVSHLLSFSNTIGTIADMAWMVSFCLMALFGFLDFLGLRGHLGSPLATDLAQTPIDHRETVAALHLSRIPVYTVVSFLVILVFPQNEAAFFPIPIERLLLFAVSFVLVLEAILRVLFLLPLHLEGAVLFLGTIMTVLAGVLMMYGVSGALMMLTGSAVYTIIAWGLFAALPLVLSWVSWNFFLAIAARSYGKRIRLILGEEKTVVDAPEPRRFLT